MKALVLLFVALLALSYADDSGHVLILTPDNFDETLKNHELVLVEFFAPWCGHCKKLAPEYAKAAETLAGTNLYLASVDADNEINKPLASRFDIRGFPTLKMFRNGVPSDYPGDRTADAIVSYMKKQALPTVSVLETAEKVKEFSTSDKVVVVGFFVSEDSEEYKTFAATASALRDNYSFGAVIGKSEIAQENGVTAPSVVIFKQSEDKSVTGADDWADLSQWVKTYSVPLIDEIGPQNYKSYSESGLPLAYLFLELSALPELLPLVRPVALATKGQVNWVYIDWAKYSKHAEGLGLSGKTVPAVVIDAAGKHFTFPEDQTITLPALQEWVGQFQSGTLLPTIKSEPVPTSQEGPVTVVVANSFESVVLDEGKDVLVEFYAPWCGHCKQLAPTYDQLGAAFANVPSVVIAKIDATANDVDPAYGVRGFPTLKFFPANNKKAPIDYNGDRSLEDLKKFVKNNASVKISDDAVKDEL